MAKMRTLQAIARLSLLTDDIEDGIDQFGTLSVMTLSPVVTSSSLPENEIVWPEDLDNEGQRKTYIDE
jgi:hypothetical protein